MALVGFVGGQQLFGDFRQVIQGYARFVVCRQSELRMDQLTGIQANQLAILLLKIRDCSVRQSFQARTETALRPAGSSRHPPQLALIARKEADDQVSFPKRIGLKDEAFAHSSGHSGRLSF